MNKIFIIIKSNQKQMAYLSNTGEFVTMFYKPKSWNTRNGADKYLNEHFGFGYEITETNDFFWKP